jgi:cbb3-type cytochrome oxidase subunit 3
MRIMAEIEIIETVQAAQLAAFFICFLATTLATSL